MIIDPKHISSREYYTTHNHIENYDMYDFLKYIIEHPIDQMQFVDHKKRLMAFRMEARPSTPQFAKDIIDELRKTFYNNSISLYSMVGFTNDSESHPIHKDVMDVLYLQAIGEVEWSIWNSDSQDSHIESNEGECIFSIKLSPGDAIWVPRNIFHFVKPLCPRVGFSFGVEGPIDPSTYIDDI